MSSISPSLQRRALVTGGAGFLGSHLCAALLAHGWQVTCLDNFSTGSRNNVSHLADLEVIEGDVNQAATWARLSDREFDVAVHYAAKVGVLRTQAEPLDVLRDVLGMQYLAQAALSHRVKKIVFASSSEVYGPKGDVPMQEVTDPISWNPYTTVKVYGEYLFGSLWQQAQVPTVSLRFFNVYGPRQAGTAYGFVVAAFIRQVLTGVAPTVFGDGTQTRDFVYIDDNVQAVLAAIESQAAHGQIVNVGTGQETSIYRLAQTVIETAGLSGQLESQFATARPIEVRRRCAAVERLADLLQVRCTTSLTAGLKATLHWHETQRMPAVSLAVSQA